MAVEDRWAAARAAKEKKRLEANINISNRDKKKAVNKVKKSPILIIIVIALILGAVGGFFAFTYLSPFEMKGYSVNGIASSEKDYVIVEMEELKEKYFSENTNKTMDDFYSSVLLKDEGVTCNFFGFDISDSVTTKYYYREDISHDTAPVDKIDLTTSGVYYIEYTSSHFVFKNITLIRTIIVTEVEVDG